MTGLEVSRFNSVSPDLLSPGHCGPELLFAETCKQLRPGLARPSSAVTVFSLQGFTGHHPLSLYFLRGSEL